MARGCIVFQMVHMAQLVPRYQVPRDITIINVVFSMVTIERLRDLRGRLQDTILSSATKLAPTSGDSTDICFRFSKPRHFNSVVIDSG